MTSMLNLEAFNNTPLNQQPFPYLVVDNILQADQLKPLTQTLPNLNMPGSVPLNKFDYQGAFSQLIEELESDAFKQAIENKFSMDLSNRPTMITYRARARQKDGRIHTDTQSKLITVLLYLNPDWQYQAGRLRVLRDGKNLENYVEEITPLIGRCLIFKVTDNCWHGHLPLDAPRRAIQLNYVTNQEALTRHLKKHGFSARMKKLKTLLIGEKIYPYPTPNEGCSDD